MDSIVLFLKEDILSEIKSKADNVQRKAPQFWLSENQKLYKRSFSGPYLLFIHPEAVELLLEELHKWICGSHIGGRSLSHRSLPHPGILVVKYVEGGTSVYEEMRPM